MQKDIGSIQVRIIGKQDTLKEYVKKKLEFSDNVICLVGIS